MQNVLVVGAGFAGSVIARQLADTGRFRVVVIDRRNHIAGNAYDPIHPQSGTRFHKYGPHIFHASNKDIVDYLSKFTDWKPYRHRVQAILPSGDSAPMPINLITLNKHCNVNLTDEAGMRALLQEMRENIESPQNAQEYLFSIYGRELTELFFGRYTQKMWGLALSDMPISVVARLPVRYSDNPYYFDDTFQIMPANGYLEMFGRMLGHENIEVRLETAFCKKMEGDYLHVFNSMPIDEYFDEQFGSLPYRSIRFEHRFSEAFEYDVPTVNFTDTGRYTRKTAWALYPGCEGEVGAHVTYEVPCSYEENGQERYYPIKTIDGWPQRRYRQYEALAKNRDNITFIGRCGQYIYYDMHQVVANSLSISKKFIESTGT